MHSKREKSAGGGLLLALRLLVVLLTLACAGAYPRLAFADVITTVNNPIGSQMNLFDYWIDASADSPDGPNWGTGGTASNGASLANGGINKDHALIFHLDRKDAGIFVRPQDLNDSVGQAVNIGIVNNVLGSDGYPVLAGTDKTTVKDDDGNVLYPNNESLRYLFDPSISAEGKRSYAKVNGLFQLNPTDGYYWYDSAWYWAQFETATNKFAVSDLPSDANHETASNKAKGDEEHYYGFFPLDPLVAPGYHTNTAHQHNHYFGLTFSAPFAQTTGGQIITTAGTTEDMTFSFSGDDDVWVFIDDVLVGDMGGIHAARSLSINFATGVVSVQGYDDSTLLARYQAAGRESTTEWSGSTFADGTKHTLKFFYLERGNGLSNMEIRYNLATDDQITAHKSVQSGSSRVNPAAGQFAYELRSYYTSENNQITYEPYTAQCAADGTINFGSIQANANDVDQSYYFSLHELVPSGLARSADGTYTQGGITYDGSVYVLKETVTTVDGLPTLQKTWYKVKDPKKSIDDLDGGNNRTWFLDTSQLEVVSGEGVQGSEPEFSNRLDSGNDVRINFVKTLLGQDLSPLGLTKGEFAFLLCDATGAPLRHADDNTRITATNDENGKVRFDVPGFTPADFSYASGSITRTYTIREKVAVDTPAGAGGTVTVGDITYDTGSIKVEVTGTYDATKAVYDPTTNTSGGDPISISIKYYRDGVETTTPIFTNRSALYGIRLTKYASSADAADTAKAPLPGASFTVTTTDGTQTTYYAADGTASTTEVKLTTGDDGTLQLSGLRAGTYTITETDAPAGYQRPTRPMTLVISNTGSARFTSYTGVKSEMTANNGVYAIEMTDLKQPNLPETGGVGALILRVAGVAALAAGVAALAAGGWGRNR